MTGETMKRFFALFLILVMVFDLGGCTALRRKFVRKRRKDLPPPLYLDLKEYPTTPTQDMYHQYWLFVRGWLEELSMSLEANSNAKRQRKAIDEAVINLEQIIYFYNEEGKQAIDPIYQELLAIRKDVHSPYFNSAMNTSIVRKRIAKAKRNFERDFTYDKASIWFEQ
jgi:hypothetical protein